MLFLRDYLAPILTMIVTIIIIFEFLVKRSKNCKMSKPEFNVELFKQPGPLVKGSSGLVRESWRIRYITFRIEVPLDNPPLSIEQVECSVRDWQSGEFKNRASQESWIYLFPLREPEKNSERIWNIQPGQSYPCCIPDLYTGAYEDGEYELILTVKCKAGEKSIEKSAPPKKFKVRGENAQWVN